MDNKMTSAVITLWVNRLIGLILCALLFCLPGLLDIYGRYRGLLDSERTAILAAFYLCAAATAYALWNMDALLCAILQRQVFIWDNVRRIRRVMWCCAAVSLICFPAAFWYAPLVFMAVIMAFLCLVVWVVCQVMKAAVVIREENDLTV